MNETMWHTASACQNTECVEVGWHTASASGGTNCVEAGQGDCGLMHVRDTKDRDGGELRFTPQAWAEFLAILKQPA